MKVGICFKAKKYSATWQMKIHVIFSQPVGGPFVGQAALQTVVWRHMWPTTQSLNNLESKWETKIIPHFREILHFNNLQKFQFKDMCEVVTQDLVMVVLYSELKFSKR